MTLSLKPHIIEHFEKMNLATLYLLLDENHVYDGVRKAPFLAELGRVFDEFRQQSIKPCP